MRVVGEYKCDCGMRYTWEGDQRRLEAGWDHPHYGGKPGRVRLARLSYRFELGVDDPEFSDLSKVTNIGDEEIETWNEILTNAQTKKKRNITPK